MGTWGVALFSDDLAADLRGEFRDLIGEGLSAPAAVDKLLTEYASSVADPDDAPVFWLALAAVQWKLGRLEERTVQSAIRVIDSGEDLERWHDPKDRKRREIVLRKLRAQLLSPPPSAKRVPRKIKSACEWGVGEVVGFRLSSHRWVLMRVIGHHSDYGGRYAVCELLDWVGESFPSSERIAALAVRFKASPRGISQFLFQEPRVKKDRSRIVRLGITSSPAQKCGGYTAFVWPHVDRQLKEIFSLA
ncbi:MAG: hypothetical protein HYX75_19950 [Acidobacteria bacterium]|nr:hypothetical protein [Acidobacteriota bacterium]